jgi:DNA processing protein
MMRTERECLIGLNQIPQLTPKRGKLLLGRFESFREVWSAPAGHLASALGSSMLGEAIASARSDAAIEEELEKADQMGVRLITLVDREYPSLLREIDDPPFALYVRGKLPVNTACTIGIVGTRRGTQYGKLVAARLASQLALKGIIVVSGLAAGIDAAAHQGALDVGGHTVAVLGCGLDVSYPKTNQPLFERIAVEGTAMSEYPLGTRPAKWTFPQRNRILSGLCRGVVVVQAPARSGSLITARLALEQGREVFAVPGNITTATSAGTNGLIRQGAKIVETIDDVLEEFPDLRSMAERAPTVEEAEEPSLGARERRVYDLIGLDPVHVDDIIARADLSPTEASHVLLLLQLEDLIAEVDGGCYVRRT